MKPRVVYLGPWSQFSGYGSAARDYLLAFVRYAVKPGLAELRICPFETTDALLPRYDELLPFSRDVLQEPGWPTHILFHAPPHQIHPAVDQGVFELNPKAKRILLTTWETDTVNPMYEKDFNLFDLIWVPSVYNFNAFPPRAPLRLVPHCYDPAFWHPPDTERTEGGRYLFYAIGTWGDRKNLPDVLRAYIAAFSATDRVELHFLVPPYHYAVAKEDIATICRYSFLPQEELPKIRLFGETRLTDAELRDFHWSRDCYINLARGEGFGLGVFEASLVGKEILSIDWGGPADFLQTFLRIPHSLRPGILPEPQMRVENIAGKTMATKYAPDAGGITGRQWWAEPDLFACADRMKLAARRRPGAPTARHLERFTYENVAKIMLRGLE